MIIVQATLDCALPNFNVIDQPTVSRFATSDTPGDSNLT
jgi:hypothetical protein